MAVMHLQIIKRPHRGGFQSVAYTGTAGTITNAVGVGVDTVKVRVTTDAHVALVTGSGVATTSDFKCSANTDYFFQIRGGEKVSAVQASGSTGGTLEVSEYVQ